MSIEDEIDHAVATIQDAGLSCKRHTTSAPTKRGGDTTIVSLVITGGVRPVAVWPVQGTIFSGPVRNTKAEGGGWKFKKAINIKGLTFEQSIYAAVQTALRGKV